MIKLYAFLQELSVWKTVIKALFFVFFSYELEVYDFLFEKN